MKVYSYISLLNETGNPYIAKDRSYIIDGRRSYKTPEDIAEFVRGSIKLQTFAEEIMYVLCFDNKSHLIGCFEAAHGSVNKLVTSPREIFQKSLMVGAVTIALAHNHPGNDPSPSTEDIEFTKHTKECGELLCVPISDHIIVCASGWCSFKEQGLI